MGKRVFDEIKKTMAILLSVFFLISITSAAVSAAPGSPEYQKGYSAGYTAGYNDGFAHKQKQLNTGVGGVQSAPVQAGGRVNTDYSDGFAAGYNVGYQKGEADANEQAKP